MAPLPAHLFPPGDLPLPGYAALRADLPSYVLAAASTHLPGDPWQQEGHELVRLVTEAMSKLAAKLSAVDASATSQVQQWFQLQQQTLIVLGVAIAWEAKQRWEPPPAGALPLESARQIFDLLVDTTLREHPDQAPRIEQWCRAHAYVVFVLSAAVLTTLMVAGALEAATHEVDEEDRMGDGAGTIDELAYELAHGPDPSHGEGDDDEETDEDDDNPGDEDSGGWEEEEEEEEDDKQEGED